MKNGNPIDFKNYVIIYKKDSEMIYLGHLDFIALWERIIRMANIPVAYTNQIQSNMKINLIQPLSLGIEGSHEILHIAINDPNFNLQNHIKQISNIIPEGITIKKIVETKYNSKWFNQHKYAVEYILIYKAVNKINRKDLDNNPLILSYILKNDDHLFLRVVNTSNKQVNINGLIFSLNTKIDIINLRRKKILFRR